jgi:hypothetical protein
MSDMIVRREGGIKISRIKESDIDTHIKNNENKMNNLLSERILNSLKNYKVNMKTRNNILTYNRNSRDKSIQKDKKDNVDKSIQKDKKETKNQKEKKHKIITLDFDSLDINDRYGNKIKEETVGGDYLFSDFYYSPESIYY